MLYFWTVMKSKSHTHRCGFTIVELLVVIAVIAILAAL
ncbi:MAG: prepilin-type N-terminal cleavage/methylation domain-containing protein, partial [Planctomycetota bacterium]|nr:prepilin-type N-terminal cleavage/methylation domain-containing protein [Planctomycetota bacterium]